MVTQTLTAITVQVAFRNDLKEIAQKETLPLSLIRTREPYVDTQPVSASPLKPGGEREFRLIFDSVGAGLEPAISRGEGDSGCSEKPPQSNSPLAAASRNSRSRRKSSPFPSSTTRGWLCG